MYFVNWIQHAVGHGGFHVGGVEWEGETVFRWIFDCGARQTTRFTDFLKTWTTINPPLVDWLFISHFDTDHVSGIDTLMSRTIVRDVMVPYVNDRELAFILLHEISRGNLDRWFVELIADPAAFFLSRGAERVTFLGADRPGGAPRDPDRVGGPLKDQQDWILKITPPPRPLQRRSSIRPSGSGGARVQLIEDRTCEILATRGLVGLRLKPYRAPLQKRIHLGLTKQLQDLVDAPKRSTQRPGLGSLAIAIAHHARTATGRAELRSIFSDYAGSSNRASLSLLSVPFAPESNSQHWKIEHPNRHAFGESVPAWLSTGDAELLTQTDLTNWEKCFASDLLNVQALSLPHHGSDKNSNAALQALCPAALLAAHVKSGSRKHPGISVAHAAGHRLACVTEQPGTELRMWFYAF